MGADDLQGRLGRERGIGRVLAARLIEEFGPDLNAMADADRDRLLEVQGLGPSRVAGVREALGLLRELSGPVVPAEPSQEAVITLPAVDLQAEGCEPLRVALPAITLRAERDGVRMEGFGLDVVVPLGEPLRLSGTWDGETNHADGTPAIDWKKT